jgi:predicted nucleic acid-binding protein
MAWHPDASRTIGRGAVTIAEIAFAIGKIRPDQRAARLERLEQGLAAWRHRFADRIFPFTEAAALAYGDITSAALRGGGPMTAPDGMIAAITGINGARLATRNLPDFETTGLELVSP